MKLLWSEPAVHSLQAIHDYIAADSPFYADLFIDRITQIAEKIPAFPRKGRIVPETDKDDIREILFQGYRIIYRYNKSEIMILAVVHGSRDLANINPWELG